MSEISFREKVWYARQAIRMTGHNGTSELIRQGSHSYSVHIPCKCGRCPLSEPYPQHMKDEDIMEEALK